MDQERLWKEYVALPPDAQQEVANFIAFLATRYTKSRTTMPNSVGDWQDDAFIGMWQDREDLADSSAWVRSVREQEWMRSHG